MHKLTIKEYTHNSFVFEIRDETTASALGKLKLVIPLCLLLIGFPMGFYFLKDSLDIPSWLRSSANVLMIPCLVIDGIIIGILVFAIQIPAFRKAALPPIQTANFDLKKGLAKGVNQYPEELMLKAEMTNWEFEIDRAKTLSLVGEDPRFDLVYLRIQGADGSILNAFYGFREDMLQIGQKLGVLLRIPFEDFTRYS